MIIAITCVIAIVVIVFVLGVRPKDLPEPEPVSPFQHLDERKAAIYENLRDLQFEYRVGKLSDADYQQTKRDLQKELAAVMAEVDRIRDEMKLPPAVAVPKSKPAKREIDPHTCPHCNAHFEKELKFCGECGKPMKAVNV
uniref:Zinc-ribbon domain-containing protein n=1 Tax=Solibacter usitatus (strain Ellin6076) TaxID=234267 RepID=Q01YR9_SOLUE